MPEPFEYAIKKDVRNNPIIREVDAARHREQWQWAGITAVLVVLLLFLAWERSSFIDNGYRRDELQRSLKAEQDLTRQLRVQWEELIAPRRIEDLAMNRLRLVHPKQGETVMLERAAPAEPPASSVVARR